MNIAMHPLLFVMVDSLMFRVRVGDALIGRPLVCNNAPCCGIGKRFNKLMERRLGRIRNDAHADIAPTFNNATNNRFTSGSTSTTHTFLSSADKGFVNRSEEHTSELQSQSNLVCRLLLE